MAVSPLPTNALLAPPPHTTLDPYLCDSPPAVDGNLQDNPLPVMTTLVLICFIVQATMLWLESGRARGIDVLHTQVKEEKGMEGTTGL